MLLPITRTRSQTSGADPSEGPWEAVRKALCRRTVNARGGCVAAALTRTCTLGHTCRLTSQPAPRAACLSQRRGTLSRSLSPLSVPAASGHCHLLLGCHCHSCRVTWSLSVSAYYFTRITSFFSMQLQREWSDTPPAELH